MAILFGLVTILSGSNSSEQYKYGLTPTTHAQYKEDLISSSEKELANFEKVIPGLQLLIFHLTIRRPWQTKRCSSK